MHTMRPRWKHALVVMVALMVALMVVALVVMMLVTVMVTVLHSITIASQHVSLATRLQ